MVFTFHTNRAPHLVVSRRSAPLFVRPPAPPGTCFRLFTIADSSARSWLTGKSKPRSGLFDCSHPTGDLVQSRPSSQTTASVGIPFSRDIYQGSTGYFANLYGYVYRKCTESGQQDPSAHWRKCRRVAQTCSLPYRRFVIGRPPAVSQRVRIVKGRQLANVAKLRYSRPQVCATTPWMRTCHWIHAPMHLELQQSRRGLQNRRPPPHDGTTKYMNNCPFKPNGRCMLTT
jgi:hypothetical protein